MGTPEQFEGGSAPTQPESEVQATEAAIQSPSRSPRRRSQIRRLSRKAMAGAGIAIALVGAGKAALKAEHDTEAYHKQRNQAESALVQAGKAATTDADRLASMREASRSQEYTTSLTDINNQDESSAEDTAKPVYYKEDGVIKGIEVPWVVEIPEHISPEQRQRIIDLGAGQSFSHDDIQEIATTQYIPEERPSDDVIKASYLKVDASVGKHGELYATPTQLGRFKELCRQLDLAQEQAVPGYVQDLQRDEKAIQGARKKIADLDAHSYNDPFIV